MVNLLFLKKSISKFSLCCMKAKALRQIIIHFPKLFVNIFVVLHEENELFLCLRTSKMLSLGVLDRCESC